MESKIQELIDIKLVNFEQAKEMTESLSRIDDQLTNGQYIYALFLAEYKKQTGYQYSILTTVINIGGEKLEKAEQNQINKLLHDYLLKLKKVRLINDKQFSEQSDRIDNHEYVHLFDFLPDLASQVNFEEWMSYERLDTYRKDLFENGIINKKENERLKSAIKDDNLKSPFQLIDYCEKSRFFDLSKYSNDPNIYIEQIHKLTSDVLPTLDFTDFKFEIKADSTESFGDYISYALITSIKSNGKTYKQKSYISPESIGKDSNYLGKIDHQKYYQIFNKILKDSHSPYRLHLIKSINNHGQVNAHQYFGVVALKKKQLKMFRNADSYWKLSYESFKNPLTRTNIDNAIKEYQKLGMLSHLDKEQLATSIESIKEKENRNLNDVLISFPDVILSFDMELGNLENPYEEIVSEYSKISHQEFNPINIIDDFDLQNETVSLSFDFNNKTYETEFKVDGDWIDTRFFEYMSKLITENNLNGKFYSLYGDGAELIYLTSEQYKYIRENKLLVFADEWESQMDE